MSGTGTQEKKEDLQSQTALAEATQAMKSSKAKDALANTLLKLASSPILHVTLLVVLCLACFGRTLGSYFLADDIGEVRYIYQIFNNNQWNLFWSNFTGNYMQVPNMAVYRPILMLSLLIDFLIWKGNALGYYLTNMLSFVGSTVLLYTFLKQLSAEWGRARSSFVAFFASALFAATPLHCESISWVVGRVDSLCCLFYLSALNCFLMSRTRASKLFTIAAVGLFFLAMGTKEMAIGLAPTMMAIGFLWTSPKSVRITSQIKERLLSGWKFSRTIWAATAVYFVIRWLALGTLLGGYAGSVGASQSANALSKWMDVDSWKRLVLPFSSEVFRAGSSSESLLFACYCALVGIVVVRALAGSLPWKWVFFLAVWALTQLAPIYRLFGIGANLEGARFCYFFSMSFSALLPVLLFSPDKNSDKLGKRLAVVSALILLGATMLLAKTAYASNIVWLHAGKEVRAVLQDAQRLASDAHGAEKFALLGIPKEHGGAHMILNGSTFEMLLSAPFTEKDFSNSFVTFDPMLFGDDTAINGSRFRQTINPDSSKQSIPAVKGPFIWNSASKKFEFIPLVTGQKNNPKTSDRNDDLTEGMATTAATANTKGSQLLPYVSGHAIFSPTAAGIQISSPNIGDGVLVTNTQISPMDIGYVRVHLRTAADVSKLPFELRWRNGKNPSDANSWKMENCVIISGTDKVAQETSSPSHAEPQTITFPVGRKWRWYSQTEVNDIAVIVPPLLNVTVQKVEFLPADFVAPTLSANNLPCTNSGAYCASQEFVIQLNPTKEKSKESTDAHSTSNYLVEISKNNHFFENFTKENEHLAVAKTFIVSKADLSVKPEQLEGPGYYQIRACNTNEQGKAISDFSDPITVLLQESTAANKNLK